MTEQSIEFCLQLALIAAANPIFGYQLLIAFGIAAFVVYSKVGATKPQK